VQTSNDGANYDRGVSEGDPTLLLRASLPTALQAPVAAKLAAAAEARVAERMRPDWNAPAGGQGGSADPTLWGPAGTPEIANRLGWLTIARRMLEQTGELELFAAEVHEAQDVRDVVLLGMGGSSLAAEVLRRSFGDIPERPRLHVLDSTDPRWIASVQDAIDPARTLFLVSSKSGGTIEPLSLFAHFWPLSGERGASFVAITDPGSGLERLAGERGFRRVFHGDPGIGGRYSALSPFGLVPAALMGIDVRGLLQGGVAAWGAALEGDQASDPGAAQPPSWLWLGAALSALTQTGRDKLTLLAAHSLASVGLWLEQLFAESTGKHGTGILPVAEEPPGEPAVYGEDRVFLHLPDVSDPDPDLQATARRLAEAGHPLITIPTRGAADLGRVFMLAELAVAVAGWGLGINPFDQPNVQQAKDATNKVLAQFEAQGELPSAADADGEALRKLLADAGPPHYVAVMAYLQPSPAFDAAVAELRAAIRARTGAATTFGYGPRFLHSTGQFHKGGPPVGRFLQLLYEGSTDAEIPGRPFTFKTLEQAQALGDLSTLRELGLPAERVSLRGADPAAALRELTNRIEEEL
jgi:transaldolase / glucose-6-phosphate isomerase